jgi:4-methyl-5(b-hydroxyethyl)-thiazole monophosphate biosynthesis
MARALVPLADGFEEIEALSVVDVLRRGGVDVVTASVAGPCEVRGAHGVVVLADAPFAEAEKDDFDAVVLPGGSVGTDNLAHSDAVLERLRRQKQEGRVIAAICAAPTVLVKAGVVEPEQHMTCYPSCAETLGRRCADVPVVADGALVTGQAAGSALLFALVVLKTLTSGRTAERVARAMVTDVL